MAVFGLVFVLGLAGLVSYCYRKRQQRQAPQHPDHDPEGASLTSWEPDRGDDVIGLANANAQPLADPPADDVDRAEAQVHAAPPADWERLVQEAEATPPSPPWADDLTNPFRVVTETGNDPFGAAAEREDPGLRESPEGEGASGSSHSNLYVDRRMQVEI